MYSYNMWQWILFFAIYCLIGWTGESLYVTWEHKKWVNRGFLNGPFLPIYGSGAIIILFATLPVRDNLILVFVLGMLSATVLEYFTGYAMEQIFKVRYWDYTVQPFNLNGYICLGCSIAWGVCAELLINLMHKPIERFVVSIDDMAGEILAAMFGVYFVTDIIVSTREAFDLRKIIIETIENNEKLRKIEKRMDVYIAFAEEDRQKLLDRLEQIKDKSEKKKLSLSFDVAEAKLEFFEKMRDRKDEYVSFFDRLEKKTDKLGDSFWEELDKLKKEFSESKESYMSMHKMHRKKSIERIMKRNPGATIRKAEIDIEDIKHIFTHKK